MDAEKTVERRAFLVQASAAAAAGMMGSLALPGAAAADQISGAAQSPLGLLDHSDFSDLAGDLFQVVDAPITLVLQEVTRHSHASDRQRPAHVRPEGFSLVFAATPGATFSDGTHLLRHPRLGSLPLLLQRIVWDESPGQQHFEAVFN